MTIDLVQAIQARDWVLATFTLFKDPHIHINISNWPEDYIFIFQDIPQTYYGVKLVEWLSCTTTINKTEYIVFDKGISIFDENYNPQNVFMYRFEDQDHNHIYYGLYDDNDDWNPEQPLPSTDWLTILNRIDLLNKRLENAAATTD